MADPFRSPSLWESLTLIGSKGRTVFPGKVSLSVRPGGLKEDEAPLKGQDGATRTFLGYQDAEATAEVQIWNAEQFNRLRKVLELYRNRRGSKPEVLQVVHPELALHGIRQMYLFALEVQPYSPVEGYRMTLNFREWQGETRNKTKKSSQIKGGGAGEDFTAADGRDIALPSAQRALANPPTKQAVKP